MNLLVITQKVDREDPVLGFFHNWLLKMSPRFAKITVICLEKGEYQLPENIKIYSLGKESGKNKIKYVKNLFNYILGLHREYDAVFVHMNQEYVLLCGLLWKLMRKKIFFWRNHVNGNLLTRIAVLLSNKVFCTSKFSYTAKFKKTVIMPVGIDTDIFNNEVRSTSYEERNNKILFLGRISTIKRPDLFVEALGILYKKGIDFIANIYGEPSPEGLDYYNNIKERAVSFGLGGKLLFHSSVPNHKTPSIYQNHQIYVNLTPSGSFDKTILEAAACGCVLVISNESLKNQIDNNMIVENNKPEDIAGNIEFWLKVGQEDRVIESQKLQKYVLENHSLNMLVDKLTKVISNR